MNEELNTSSGISRTALILTGGGARAAYQVGVLKAVSEICPKRRWPFPIIVGTSAGAVSASILAANVTRWHQSMKEIENVWANFRINQVFRSDATAMLKAGGRWMGSLFTGGAIGPPKSLLDNSPLRELLSQVTDFDAVRVNVAHGHLRALALCATSYFTARSVSFFEADTTIGEWSRTQRHGERAPLSLDYLMASLGMPFLFPPSCLRGEYFGDGAMRQTAPLSPAIHLGADRMLVVGVRDERPDAEPPVGAKPEPPTFAHLGGYMLDTLFMDGLYTDLERLSRTNRIVEQIGDCKLSGPLAALRPLHTLVIVPHQDLRSLAAEFAHELPRGVRLLLRGLGASSNSGLQLVSYLLFESGFTRALIEMGYKDAMAMEDELRAFIFDEPMATLYAPAHLKLELDR